MPNGVIITSFQMIACLITYEWNVKQFINGLADTRFAGCSSARAIEPKCPFRRVGQIEEP